MDTIKKYFPDCSEKQLCQFEKLIELYKEWNERINVISRKDMTNFYERHVLHSLSIAKVIQFAPRSRILDVGTGGGFPGIPLAILFPQVHFHLIDSIGKKIKVVKEVSESLELKNVKAEKIRAELISDQYDFVVSRAVTAFPEFYHWVRTKISNNEHNPISNGILYLKGGDLEEELKDFKNQVQIYSLKDYFDEEFFDTKKLVYLANK